MKILFDTHTFLWFIQGDASLSATSKENIEDRTNTVLFSAASYWEICIKISIGTLRLQANWQNTIETLLPENGILWLDIKREHMNTIITLPWHHRDPFDRLLIAQAINEQCVICTKDRNFAAYGLDVLW
jgi:PIN domain nuclease of toxin-antitoxin system